MSSESPQSPALTKQTKQLSQFRERLVILTEAVDQQHRKETVERIRNLFREEANSLIVPVVQEAMQQVLMNMAPQVTGPDPAFLESMERAGAQVGRLADGVARLEKSSKETENVVRQTAENLAGTMGKMLEESVTVLSETHKKTGVELQAHQKLMARKQLFWTWATGGAVLSLVVLVAFAAWGYIRWEQKSGLASEINALKQEKALLVEAREKALAEKIAQDTQKQEIASQVERLKAEETSVRLAIKQAAESASAVNQVRTKTQEDIRRLQDLQNQNRFRLLEGEGENVFVEILPDAKPIKIDGKLYVKVPAKKE